MLPTRPMSALYDATLAFSLFERSRPIPLTHLSATIGLASEAALQEVELTSCLIAVLLRASLSIQA